MRTTALGLILSAIALAALPATARAQERDPLKLYARNYNVLVENNRVRVLDGGAAAHGIIVELKTLPAGAPAAGPSPDDQRVTAFTLIHGIPGKEADLKQHLLSLAAPTRAEPGNIAYDLYQHPHEKHEFLRFEVWSSRAALEAHKQMPHLKASFDKRQREGWTTEIVIWNRVPE